MPRKRKEIIRLIEESVAQRVSVLNLSNCDLRELIGEVCRMDWLTELDLGRCHLDVLPEAIGNLQGLTRLVLTDNQITTLPESIYRLGALQFLNLQSAGYRFDVSVPVRDWLLGVPEVIWTDGKPFGYEPPKPVVIDGDHPNLWLVALESALELYGVALAMEDRSYSGYGKREEADTKIARIFSDEPELAIIFPEFYRDFLDHGFYSINKESEKTIKGNPFHLPTPDDDEWRAGLASVSDELPPPLSLRVERDAPQCRVFAVDNRSGEASKVLTGEYGAITVSNQPYAADEEYFADIAARLYRAGEKRFYVCAEIHGYGGGLSNDWYGSDDGGRSWRKQARLTYQWLEKILRD